MQQNFQALEKRNINLSKHSDILYTTFAELKKYTPAQSKRHRRLDSNPRNLKTEAQQDSDQNRLKRISSAQRNELKDNLIFYSPRKEIDYPEIPQQNTSSKQSLVKDSFSQTQTKFTAFRELTQSQQNFFKSCNNFRSNTSHSRSTRQNMLDLQLVHNQSQLQMIKNDCQQNRNFTYNGIFKDLKSTSSLHKTLKKKTKVTEVNPYQPKKPQGYMNFPDANLDPQQQQFAQLLKKPQKEQPEDEEDPFQNNQIIEWNCVSNRVYLDRPTFREGATMFQFHKQLFLSGGRSDKLKSDLFMYDIKTGVWRQIDNLPQQSQQRNSLVSPRMGHSVNVYGHNAIFFGGEGEYDDRTKRRCNINQINILALKKMQWSQLNTTVTQIEPTRNHAASVIQHFFYITGGVDNHEHYLNKMILVNLDNGRCREYTLPFTKGIAFHKQLTIFKKLLIPSGKRKYQKVKEEGIYVWGGKTQKGNCCHKLHVLKLDEHYKPSEWKSPQIQGEPPAGRFGHTMDYYARTNSIIIFGGMNNKGQIFNDIWFLRLNSLTWVQLAIKGTKELDRYSHASALEGDKLFIFGGISNHKYASWDLFYLELDSDLRKNKNGQEFKEVNIIQKKRQSIPPPFACDPSDFNIGLPEKDQSPKINSNAKKLFSNFLSRKMKMNSSNDTQKTKSDSSFINMFKK